MQQVSTIIRPLISHWFSIKKYRTNCFGLLAARRQQNFFITAPTLPMMGLTSTEKEGKVTKNDALIGKNYLNEKEISQLKLIVEQFLAYAEAQALAEKPMYMRDWVQKLRLVLTMNEKNILEHAGSISHELAVKKATKEYIAYKEHLRQIEHMESLKQLDKDLKQIMPRRNNKKNKDEKSE